MNETKVRSRRHFGRIIAALKQARRTRDELARRAFHGRADAPLHR